MSVCVIVIILFFIGAAPDGIVALNKKVFIYKEKLVYSTLFGKKEYKISDICTSNTKNTNIDFRRYDNSMGYAEDKVTTFYAETGEKLFQFIHPS